MTRVRLLLGLNLLGLLVVVWLAGGGEWVRKRWFRVSPDRPVLVLIVMDTVRADRLSVCGHARPTSPTLASLVADGATLRCDAVAPGSWTVPSHASLFTGAPPEVHGAHFAGAAGEATDVAGLVLRPLDGALPTLAEQLSDAGFQTVGVSANRVLRAETGLQRGFSHFEVAPLEGGWTDEGILPPLRRVLRGLREEDGPLFLFVNLFEAHDPWPEISDGHPFLPPRPGVLRYFAYLPGTRSIDPDGVWQRYVQGRMTSEGAAALRREVADRYDDGVWRADRSVARVLAELRAHGWDASGRRVVLTADHGEFLGESGLLRHGRVLLEGNQRVPLLVHDTEGTVPLAPQLSGRVVPALVRDGRLPKVLPLASAAAWPDPLWREHSGGRWGGSASAAIWSEGQKRVWTPAGSYRVAEEDELRMESRVIVDDDPDLESLGAAVLRSALEAPEVDPAVIEALRAAGYVE